MANDFSSRLRKAIEDREISASELSRISGVGKSDISYYLKGRYVPKQDKCYMLAKALNVDPGWLMIGYEQSEEQEQEETVQPHKGTKGTHRCLTDEEINLIETTPHRMQLAAMFMLKAGLRRGEILALTKDDIHDDRISINKAVKFEQNTGLIGQTKTDSSVRTVPLFSSLKPFIDDIGNYAYTTRDGRLATKKSFEQCWVSYMHCLSEKAGHPICFRCHDLRHTFITKARDKGIDIHIVMNWVGHSSEAMILQIYDHPSEEREMNAIKAMEQ